MRVFACVQNLGELKVRIKSIYTQVVITWILWTNEMELSGHLSIHLSILVQRNVLAQRADVTQKKKK